jgi:predicted ferric reductase
VSVAWFLIRGSGLLAFGLLAASMCWGLVLSMKARPRAVKSLTSVHEALSVSALLATAVHMFVLWRHDFVDFTLDEVLVPGASDWRPLAVAWGIMAFYGMALVTVSFYLRGRISQRYWRLLHFTSFGVFAAALVHGIMAGTDTSHPAVLGLYVSSLAAVLVLLAMRVARETGVDESATDERLTRRSA